MRNTYIIIVMALFSGSVFGQSTPIDKLFDKYSEQEGFTSVYISEYMFKMIAKLDESNTDEAMNAMKGIKSIRILTADSVANIHLNFYKELSSAMDFKKFEELMVIKEKGQDTKMLIREEQGKIAEFLMVGGGKNNFIISILGNINLETISGLSSALDVEGMEALEKLDEK